MTVRAGLLPLLVLVAACGGIPRAEPTHVAVARTRYPDADVEMLTRGRTLYVERCGGCHSLPLPSSQSRARWPAIVARMAPRAVVDQTSERAIAAYVYALADQ